jgi:putative sterol carrier protein
VGQALETAVLELGKWGSRFVPPSMDGVTVLGLNSYALTLKTFFRPEQAQGVHETYELHIGNEVLQVQIAAGAIHVQQGTALPADAVFHTDIATYLGLLLGQIQPDAAIAEGLMRVEGDPGALSRFLSMCGVPGSH